MEGEDLNLKSERERGDRFLSAYTIIEQEMRKRFGDPSGRESFRHLVDLLKEKDTVIKRFKDDLEQFAELRNAIVHERISPDYLIAVPLPETVERIEEIASKLKNPPLVYPLFRRKVLAFDANQNALHVMRSVKHEEYSQFPVYDGSQYIGLLTSSGIARWAASVMISDGGSDGENNEVSQGKDNSSDLQTDAVRRATCRDMLYFEKDRDRGRFISRDRTIYDAIALFNQVGHRENKQNGAMRQKKGAQDAAGRYWGAGETHRQVAALLITENGKRNEELLGIITPSDMVALDF